MDFAAMVKQQKDSVLTGEAFKEKPRYNVDERFYKISKDQKGNGKVKIRFIPSMNSEKNSLNMVTTRLVHNVNWHKTYGDKNSEKRWHSGVCPRSKDKSADCPICNYGFEMANTIDRDDKENADLRRDYLREFVSRDELLTNIMVLKDEINPENEGKIFLFRLSKTVYDMFIGEAEKVSDQLSLCETEEDRMARNFPKDLEGFDPFDLMVSKDMWLIYKNKKEVKKASEHWGSSYFDSIFTSVAKNMDEYKEIVENAYCLDEFISEDAMPTNEFLEKEIDRLTFKDSNSNKVQQETKENVSIQKPVEQVQETKVVEEVNVEKEIPVQETKVVEEVSPPQPTSTDNMSDDEFLNSILNS